jgi:dCMP deaminase
MRISREQMYMEMARTSSKRSTCHRLNVGAVITADDRFVSSGYNGSPPGEAHCEGSTCPLSATGGCMRARHAEWNAIDFLPEKFHSENFTEFLTIYCTHSPCPNCAKSIINAKIKRVVYEVPYRDTSPVELMLSKGIQVLRYSPSGYVFDHLTNEIRGLN